MTRTRALWAAWGGLLALGWMARLLYGYDGDELQHLHFAWNIGQGQLPYRDFFEHHPPLLHFLLAPFVRLRTDANTPLLVAIRLVSLSAVVALLLGLYRLLRRVAAPAAACWGTGAFLLTHPFEREGLDLRPDWIALACLLFALHSLLEALHREDGRMASRAAAAGLLLGAGACFTQKVLLLSAGAFFWLLGACLCAPETGVHRRRTQCLLILLAGSALPLLLLALPFLLQGEGRTMYEHVIGINLRWPSEGTWRYTAQESMVPGFGLFVLAFAGAAYTFREYARHLSGATTESLLAALLVVGTALLLRTPVPHPQAFLFLVVPWVVGMGTVAVARYAGAPQTLRRDRWYLMGAFVLCLMALKWANLLLAATVWGGLCGWLFRRVTQEEEAARRLRLLFAGLLAISVLVYIGRAVDTLLHREGAKQARFMRYSATRIPPGEPVLQTWPLALPFRPGASRHHFAHGGVIRLRTPAGLEQEYIQAAQQGRVFAVLARPEEVQARFPRFASVLRTDFVRCADSPPTRAGLSVYLRR